MTKLRNTLLLFVGACSIHINDAFITLSPSAGGASAATTTARQRLSTSKSSRCSTSLKSYSNTPGSEVGAFRFRGNDTSQQRDYNGRIGAPINSRKPMDDPFAPPPSIDMNGRVVVPEQPSNLSPPADEEDSRIYDTPERDYNGRAGLPINSRRSMDDPFAPPPPSINN
mmetsp:Transcript_22178/g.46793  ORF Transcript_22178/g.46793 Transcript_22178/m.46793 type:complete len:169 (-) Transcript_22178:381-887(-)|eukprot:CAMPEP_0183737270 /NCGR_PEP_ID=MMETSP0737-20130205/51466_1 /TAXON_ID=385413 /ORGANISM="Thalassiosira miniscula, Strain CCMP1093" /LENGTH=168 /DNA_ID=CAMNT_0025971505 /DNA_START=64 /DNA_END=570 /DNA_ORIENTATION=-